ncbi:MAG: tetratricopeptide repeat protein, partial [Acidobacteriota bacterium]
MDEQRKQHLRELLDKDYDLLRRLEDRRRVEPDEIVKANLDRQIQELKSQIDGHKRELGGMPSASDNGYSNVGISSVPTSLHQLPSPPADFTGRQAEIDELLGKIEQGGVTISGLRGMGGIGKTALALVLGKALKSKYPDAQFYLDLKGAAEQQPLSPVQIMQQVIGSIHPEMKLPDDMDRLSGLYNSVLDGKRALLVMDNARDDKQVRPLLPPDGCVMIITSRQHFNLPGLFVKDLDTLSPSDACDLLLKIAPRIGDQADEMARLCGYLPLALRLAADALSNRKSLSVDDYLKRLAKEQERLKLIDASIILSYGLLSEELQQRWRLLAWFPDYFHLDAVMFMWCLELDHTKDTLDELVGYSLLEWNKNIKRYWLHDLVKIFAKAKLSEDDEIVAEKRFVNLILSSANPKSSSEKGFYYLLRRIPRVVIRVLESAITNASKLKLHKEKELLLYLLLSQTYACIGNFQKATAHYEESVILARKISNYKKLGDTLHYLGVTYFVQGNTFKAMQYFQECIRISDEITDRGEAGTFLFDISLTLDKFGKLNLAI